MNNNVNLELDKFWMLENKSREEIESEIKEISNTVLARRIASDDYEDIYFSIRLGDLISEISYLSGVRIDDIHVSLLTNIRCDDEVIDDKVLDEIEKSIECSEEPKGIMFRLWSEANKNYDNYISFSYFTFLPFMGFSSIQASGRQLLEHISFVDRKYGDILQHKEVVIDKDIENVVCNFSAGCLNYTNGISWYPASLISQAVINCVLMQYDEKIGKVKARTRNL